MAENVPTTRCTHHTDSARDYCDDCRAFQRWIVEHPESPEAVAYEAEVKAVFDRLEANRG